MVATCVYSVKDTGSQTLDLVCFTQDGPIVPAAKRHLSLSTTVCPHLSIGFVHSKYPLIYRFYVYLVRVDVYYQLHHMLKYFFPSLLAVPHPWNSRHDYHVFSGLIIFQCHQGCVGFRSVPGSLEAWLLVRSLRTLPLRVNQQNASALCIVQWLSSGAASHVVKVHTEQLTTTSDVHFIQCSKYCTLPHEYDFLH